MTATEKHRRRAAEIRRILFRRMADKIGDWQNVADMDFEAVLEEVAREMADEIQTFHAQRTAELMREAGIKPH